MEHKLIPFGKYKGQPLEQLQNDPSYTDWLLSQSWFAERYSGIRTIIINNFKENHDSPRHNALQARFLDRQFAFSVAMIARGWKIWDEWMKQVDAYKEKHKEEIFEWKNFSVNFEERGWDVVVSAQYEVATRDHAIDWGGVCKIELKPIIGEEFPSVLRQVKSRNSRNSAVLVEEFTAKSVNFNDVKTIFAASQVNLLRVSDIKMLELPLCFAA